MSKGLAFDKKNKQDYDKNTQLIKEALSKISTNPKLKATKIQIAELTGLGRNTITNRANEEESQEINNALAKIKKKRKGSDKERKEEKVNQELKLKEELYQIGHELVYWFTKAKKIQNDLNQLQYNHDIMSESRNYYENELKKEQDKTKKLENKIATLNQLFIEIKKD